MARRVTNKKFNKDLKNMKSANPKVYWKMLQGGYKKKEHCPLLLIEFHYHSKNCQIVDSQRRKFPM